MGYELQTMGRQFLCFDVELHAAVTNLRPRLPPNSVPVLVRRVHIFLSIIYAICKMVTSKLKTEDLLIS